MPQKNQNPLKDAITEIAQLPALALCELAREGEGLFYAKLLAKKFMVHPMGRTGRTPEEAAEHVKTWFLSELRGETDRKSRGYQPLYTYWELAGFLVLWRERASQLHTIKHAIVTAPYPEEAMRKRRVSIPQYGEWSNSATYLTNLYVTQEETLRQKIEALRKAGTWTATHIRRAIGIAFAKSEDAKTGLIGNKIVLDSFAQGPIDWSELMQEWALLET